MKVVAEAVDLVRRPYELAVLFCPEESWVGAETIGILDQKLGGVLRELAASNEFRGEKGETALVHTRGDLPTRRVLLVGLGPAAEVDIERFRLAAAAAARRATDIRVPSYGVVVPPAPEGISPTGLAQAVVEGSVLALHRLREYQTREAGKPSEVREIQVGAEPAHMSPEIEKGASVGEVVSSAACWARDLAQHPANVMTPGRLAEEARGLGEFPHIEVRVLERPQMEELGMGCLLAVARGSHLPPQFIILDYHPAGAPEKPVVLVGKGITFDSGGISLKDRENMGDMKTDMSGAAGVLGVFRATASLGLPVRLVGLVPATENLPGGDAYRPGDVLRAMNGKTVEVISTDAEGRLVLADALSYAREWDPAAVIDLATLTGAIVVALGHETSAVMGTDPELVAGLRRAGEVSGERVWELPLWPEYRERIKSEVADMKNTGGRPGGAITAGLFLAEFAEGYRWAHLDIAGTSLLDREISCLPKGPSGVGVRLLTQFLRSRCSRRVGE